MLTRRVAITGAAGFSPLGGTWSNVETALRAGRNCVQAMPEWSVYRDLNTRLAAPVQGFAQPAHFTRKKTRSMGRVALLAVRATELALEQAGLSGDALLKSGDMGIAYGSSAGSSEPLLELAHLLIDRNMSGMKATSYVRLMSHTAAVNISVYFGIQGRIVPTSSACTAGSQGIGYAYEAIKFGRQKAMIAGGAEGLCVTQAAIFDMLYATSTRNETPERTPRPFDQDRDGLVVGEGAASLILEDYEHARARGAPILAEIVGYGTNADGGHVTRPDAGTMAQALRLALQDANLSASAIGYVNAHGTATEHGDIAESSATRTVMARPVPMASLKSYTGHTLGACGALEAWYSMEMMNRGWFAPTINLDRICDRCAELDYITGVGRNLDVEYVMSNNFAFGGINTSLILRRQM